MPAGTGLLPHRVVDALAVVVVGGAGMFGLLGPVVLLGADAARVSGAGVVLVALQAAALWWRRQRPLPVLAVAVATLLLAEAIGDPNTPSYFGVHVAAYSVGAYAPRRQALFALVGLVAAAVVDAAVVRLGPGPFPDAAVALSPSGVLVVVAWTLGRYVAVRRAYLETLLAYAAQHERDHEEQARAAVREERRRIARELHDQVAHHLGVVSLQTQAARRWLDRDQARTATALQSAEHAARSALETMPAILHALRADDLPATLEPQPSLAGLPELVATMTTDDVTIDLRTVGEPLPLPAAVELTAYRVVQEALTNVVRHAGPARALVEIRFDPERLEVEITDDGRGLAATPPTDSGFGLVGMRERVDLVEGTLTVGPRDGGGFVVRAALPTTGVSA